MSRKNQPLVSINLLAYNAMEYIRPCLAAVLSQSYPNFELIIIDNASGDGTVEYLKEIKRENVRVIFNKKNVGFSAGHNQAIRLAKGEYILCLNQDAVLDKDFVWQAVEAFKKDNRLGAIQGKLLRWNAAGNKSPKFVGYQICHIIDTVGLVVLKNRRIVGLGQGELDQGQFDCQQEIFGVDGAAPVYRRQALEDIKIKTFCSRLGKVSAESQNYNQNKNSGNFEEYFDEDFFCYKEDVDLAWRMRLYGWKALYQPKCIGWHARTAGDSAATGYFSIIRERRRINQFAKYVSFKNQRLMQIKNEQFFNLLLHLPWFLPKEILSWIYVVIFERFTCKAIKELWRQMPLAFKKRKIVMAKKRISAKQMRKWFK